MLKNFGIYIHMPFLCLNVVAELDAATVRPHIVGESVLISVVDVPLYVVV